MNMPSKNRLKIYTTDSYYHVYNRGVNKGAIFKEPDDYRVFLQLLKRHNSQIIEKDSRGRPFKNYAGRLDLLAFCLMPNHFHLLFYQIDTTSLKECMQSIMTSYVGYFNKKYKRRGPLFEDVYKASNIFNEAYLHHISRYIHLNPKEYKKWDYSSYHYYIGKHKADWLNTDRIMSLFESADEYKKFTEDYEDHHAVLEEIKHELADN